MRLPAALLLAALLALPALAAPGGVRWLKGDWHVHTTRSHDVCDPAELLSCAEPWTAGLSPEQQVLMARARGLDYVAITDHDAEPWPGRDGPTLVLPGFEASVGSFGASGHEGITFLGTYLPKVSGAATPDLRLQEYNRVVHDQGGLVIVNHPRDARAPFTFSDATAMQADAVEAWNGPWLLRDDIAPLPGASDNPRALAWYEALLDQGARLPVTGGSDSHWLVSQAVNGPGEPATWVFGEATPRGIEAAVRQGRTFVSESFLGPELHLTGSPRCDDDFPLLPGDTASGPNICVRVGSSQPGLVRLRAGGPGGAETIIEVPALPDPGFEVDFPAGNRTWVRADLLGVEQGMLLVRAVTSPIYHVP